MPSFLFPILHIPYMQRRATDPLHGDDTYLKKRYSQFYIWRLWMLDILETTCAPLWIFFNLLVSTGLTWATTGKDVSIERCPKALIRRQSCLTESCVQRAVLEEAMNGRRLSESRKKKKNLTLKGSTCQRITIHACAVCNATRSSRLHIHRYKLLGLIVLGVASFWSGKT